MDMERLKLVGLALAPAGRSIEAGGNLLVVLWVRVPSAELAEEPGMGRVVFLCQSVAETSGSADSSQVRVGVFHPTISTETMLTTIQHWH